MTAPTLDLTPETDEPELPASDAAAAPETDSGETDAPSDDDWDEDEDDSEPDAPEGDVSPEVEAVAEPDPVAASASTPVAADAPPSMVEIEDADGGVYTLHGARFELPKAPGELGRLVFEHPRAIQRTRTLMTNGRKWENSRHEVENFPKVLKAEVEKAEAGAKQLWSAVQQMVNLSDDEILAEAARMRAELPSLQKEIENAELKAELERLRNPQRQPETFQEPAPEDLEVFHEREVHGQLSQLNAPWLDAAGRNRLAAVAQTPAAKRIYARNATADDVQRAAQQGVRVVPGQPIVDYMALREYLQPFVDTLHETHQQVTAAKAGATQQLQTLSTPAKNNAATLAKLKPVAPKVATAAPSAPAADLSFEEQREQARNKLGQFITQAMSAPPRPRR